MDQLPDYIWEIFEQLLLMDMKPQRNSIPKIISPIVLSFSLPHTDVQVDSWVCFSQMEGYGKNKDDLR